MLNFAELIIHEVIYNLHLRFRVYSYYEKDNPFGLAAIISIFRRRVKWYIIWIQSFESGVVKSYTHLQLPFWFYHLRFVTYENSLVFRTTKEAPIIHSAQCKTILCPMKCRE